MCSRAAVIACRSRTRSTRSCRTVDALLEPALLIPSSCRRLAAAAPPRGPPAPTSSRPTRSSAARCEPQKAGDNEAAALAFEEAAKASPEKDPKTARMYAAAGNLWIAANQPGKAALDLDQALALPGLEAEQRGEALLDRARAAEAQDDLKTARAKADRGCRRPSPTTRSTGISPPRSRSAKTIRATAQSAIGKALTLAPTDPDDPVRSRPCRRLHRRRRQGTQLLDARGRRSDPNGRVGKAAAKAVEMLGVTPTVKSGRHAA